MKLKHDHADPFTIDITSSPACDATQRLFHSSDNGRSLMCINETFCEDDALYGRLAKLQLSPAIPGNHYCFHLHTEAGIGPTSSVLPICYDEDSECLVQRPSEPGCKPAIFALQTSSSVALLQEIINTTTALLEQKRKLSWECTDSANRLLQMRKKLACNRHLDRNGEDQVQYVSSRLAEEEQQKRLAEEEQLVFLESSLEFQKEQLRAALERAGEGAEHGLPEACKLDDCEDSFCRTRSAPCQIGQARSKSLLAGLSPSKIARSLLAGQSPSKLPRSYSGLRLQ